MYGHTHTHTTHWVHRVLCTEYACIMPCTGTFNPVIVLGCPSEGLDCSFSIQTTTVTVSRGGLLFPVFRRKTIPWVIDFTTTTRLTSLQQNMTGCITGEIQAILRSTTTALHCDDYCCPLSSVLRTARLLPQSTSYCTAITQSYAGLRTPVTRNRFRIRLFWGGGK